MLKAEYIDEDIFDSMYRIKTYCESKKRCSDCKIGKKPCIQIASNLIGEECDISTLEIGKIKDKPICFTTT